MKKYEKEWKKHNYSQDTIDTFRTLHDENIDVISKQLSHIVNDETFTNSTHFKRVSICNANLFMLDITKYSVDKAYRSKKLKITFGH